MFLALFRNVIGATSLPALKGKAGRLRRTKAKRNKFTAPMRSFCGIFFYSLRFTYWLSANRSNNSIGAA
jgi:hypothetical protein